LTIPRTKTMKPLCRPTEGLSPALVRVFVHCSAALMLLGGSYATGQTASPAPGVATAAPAGNSKWVKLTAAQQQALAPLAPSWDTLSEGQRRKWVSVAASFPRLDAAGQEKMQSRMLEWASLTPKERALARLNFTQTQSIGGGDRASEWEAYQALSPEDRQKLAGSAAPKPAGAAVAIKPVSAQKLTAVPVTRHTPEPQRAAVLTQLPVNQNTLLPIAAGTDSADKSAAVKP